MTKTNSTLWNRIKRQAERDYDALFGAFYNVWAINTSENPGLYLWENWRLVFPVIDSIINLSDEKAFIRTNQSFEFENKWLGFGRMKWDEENNKKWTSKYRTRNYKDQNLQFYNTEIWAPDWNHCIKKGIGPAVFVNIYYHHNLDIISEGILLALPVRLVKKNKESINSKIENLSKLVPNSTTSMVKRYWNPGKGFVNSIEDMNPQELIKIVKNKI